MKSSDFVDLAAPDRACGCAAKLSLRSEHELPHESRSGAATKKEPQKQFLAFMLNLWNYYCPLTGLAPAPQSSPLRSEHELLPESRSGAATKKEPQKRFLLVASVKKDNFTTFCADSNYSPLPLTGLAAAPQSSPLRSEHERHFSSIVKGNQKPRHSLCWTAVFGCP